VNGPSQAATAVGDRRRGGEGQRPDAGDPRKITEAALVAQVLMKHARTPVERADFAVPTPPTDNEKYWYMGRQHRWLLLAQAASFILIAYSIARFAT
jgi:hypothetical protein